MTNCNQCGEKPKKSCTAFPKAVVEINNPEKIVLFRKVVIPASMGGRDALPPAIGKYHNVLLEYEADGSLFLYSSDGIPTQLSTDVTDLQRQLDALGVRVDTEHAERVSADEGLSGDIENEALARQDGDTALGNRITDLDNSLATVAKTGSYNDLSNKPTIGNGTLTVKRNNTSVGTFNANATTNTSINIAVPTQTSQLTNNGSSGNSAYVEADDLANVATSGDYNDLSNKPVPDSALSLSSNNAVRNSTISNALNRNVMTDINLNTNASTTTVQIDGAKRNLYSGATSTKNLALPVASSTEAGVMNTATFNAVSNNTNNINALLNGAVAVTGLPASPAQANITSAWQAETGLSTLINRASVYDVTNNKVWTYYTNDQTWHATSNTSQVTVNTFTNTSEGVIKGSTNVGQIFAENDGTGSVNGWDTISNSVSANTSNISSLQTAVAGKQDTLTAGSNITIAGNTISANVPTVNNATLTIQKNGANVQTFTANSSTNKTANITVPTAVSELTNDADYATNTALNTGLATKQDTLTAGSNIQINNNTISATDTTYTAGNAIDIINGEISADIHPADFFTAEDTVSDCGSELSLDNTMASTLRSVELKGDTYQQTYSGKNLFNKDAPKRGAGQTITATDTGVETTLESITGGYFKYGGVTIGGSELLGKTLTLSATITQKNNATPRLYLAQSNSTGALAISSLGTSLSATGSRTYTVPSSFTSGADCIALVIYSNNGNSSAQIGDKIIYDNLQIEVGSTDTDYEKFVGGISAPNPDYPQEVQTVTGEQTIEVTGKNLCKSLASTKTQNGVTMTKNADGTYTATGTPTGVAFILPQTQQQSDIFPAGTYTFSLSSSQVYRYVVEWYSPSDLSTRIGIFDSQYSSDAHAPHTLTTTEPFCFRISLVFVNGAGQAINYTCGFQIETSSTATTYEPYQSQSYEINLGKNLFDINGASGAYRANKTISNQTITSTATVSGTGYVAIAIPNSDNLLGKECSISFSAQASIGDARFRIADGDSADPSVIGSVIKTIAGNGSKTETVTFPTSYSTGKDCFVVLLYPHTDSSTWAVGDYATFTNIQLELGSTATPYAPYFTPIELCKIGNYQDYIYKSGDDWYVHKACGKQIVDTSNIALRSTYTNVEYATFGKPTDYGGYGAFGYSYPIVCTHAIHSSNPGSWDSASNIGHLYSGAETVRLWIGFAKGTGLDAIKTKLTGCINYYALGTPTDTQITDATLVAQLNALAEAKSYNDQTNIIVTAAGENLPATLCVEAYRKSLSGVIEAIDNACTCRNNLVVQLPNGMTTYTNDDAPIPISEVSEAFKRGQSVFLVDEVLNDVYTVTAVNMDDGVWSMRADQTGINPRKRDGYWHINGGDDAWTSVTFINDTTPDHYSPIFSGATWSAFTDSTPLLNQYRKTYYPASSNVQFNNGQETVSVAELWAKLDSSSWNGNPVILRVPLQEISTRTTGLVDNGFTAESPYLTISVSLGPDNYFERETPEYTITGWAAEWTPLVYDRKGAYTVGIVRVVENGNTTYSFVVSLTEVEKPVG